MIQIAQTIKDAVYMEKTCPVAPCKGIQERSAERGVAGSNSGRTNTQGLKITEENVLLCCDIYKGLDILVFSDNSFRSSS